MLTRRFAGGTAIVDGSLVEADVEVANGLVVAVRERSREISASELTGTDQVEVVDCSGLVIAPGFIDLQCNGAAGHDLTSEPGSIDAVGHALVRFGVTSFLPTVVTAPADRRERAIDALRALRRGSVSGAEPIGLHFEGPMISPSHRGAHVSAHIANVDDEELETWIASGVVSLVTLAPERDGALETIRRLRDAGIVVAAGHTAMTPEVLARAREHGLTYVTHLFNAMAPFGHRAPGPIGAVLGDDSIVAGLIADGIHVDPVAVRMAWNALGPRRTSLVSDAVGALGLPHGRTRIAGLEIVYDDTGVRTLDGVLAGSALALDQAVRNLIAWTGCTLVDAIATVTSTPADLLGLPDRGRLAVGSRADLTILDEDARLVRTVVAGETRYAA